MSKPSAKIIADSVCHDIRITGIEINAHKFINAEINTHRVSSKSFRSSRAVPNNKLLDEVRDDPALPVKWLKNKPGMQGGEPMTDDEINDAQGIWLEARRDALFHARRLAGVGLHKQWANRVIEPFMMTTAVISATDWENLLALRLSPEAQSEFEYLAEEIYKCLRDHVPEELQPGDWHRAYIDEEDSNAVWDWVHGKYRNHSESFRRNMHDETLNLMSAARSARNSYKVFDADRRPSIEEDLNRAYQLTSAGHWGPFEHQATPDVYKLRVDPSDLIDHPNYLSWLEFCNRMNWEQPHLHGNLHGWCQARKYYPGEVRTFDIHADRRS